MTILDILNGIEATQVASAVRGDIGWELLFPIVETIHVLALAVVFGSILMVDLRLLGIASRGTSISKLSAEVLPYTWVAFGLAVITGTLLFMSKAHTYYYNPQFRLKFLCMFLAGINMLVFHFGSYRSVLTWDTALRAPAGARTAGGMSILLWVGVIFCGRWIGFTS